MTNNAPPRLIDGKYVLLAVFILGLAGAGGGWWYQHNLQRRPLELWGSDAARLILYSPEVEFCDLRQSSGDSLSAAVTMDGQSYVAENCRSVVGMPGFVHLRHSLLTDHSFDWTDLATGAKRWRSLLRFRNGEKTITLVLADDFRYAMLRETGATACITPIASGMKTVLRQAR